MGWIEGKFKPDGVEEVIYCNNIYNFIMTYVVFTHWARVQLGLRFRSQVGLSWQRRDVLLWGLWMLDVPIGLGLEQKADGVTANIFISHTHISLDLKYKFD